MNLMRNGLGGAVPENAELAFSGGFAATAETDFELIQYNNDWECTFVKEVEKIFHENTKSPYFS